MPRLPIRLDYGQYITTEHYRQSHIALLRRLRPKVDAKNARATKPKEKHPLTTILKHHERKMGIE